MVSSGGFLIVLPDGVASGTVSAGGEIVSTGVVLVQPNAQVAVFALVATDIVITSGAKGYVLPSGTASFTTVNSGGAEMVYSGGTTVSTTLHGRLDPDDPYFDAGHAYVSFGGMASFTTVSSGGYEEVNGTTVNTTVDSGGIALLYGDGSAVGTVVNSGGSAVDGGGTTTRTMVNSGGTEDVYLGGTASFTVVSSGGTEDVFEGGITANTTINNGGRQVVSRGNQDEFSPYGGCTAIRTTVSSGGFEYVSASAATSFTTVSSGGYEVVFNSGTANGATVSRGGYEIVYAEGSAVSATVSSGGYEVVSIGGTATSTTVSNGGYEIAYSGGWAIYATVSSGGFEVVFSSGTAAAPTVSSGGYEIIYSGGTAYDTVMNVGGAIDVTYLSFTSGGSASVNTSGVLTVSVGGHSYSQQLEGDYADVHFQLGKDAGSGTLVTAKPGAPCYRSGTRILTDRGEVAVEALRVGDLVRTVLGGTAAPIIWIGRRVVDCARHPQPPKVWPVCVSAGAYGPDLPHSDLFLSPDHAVYVGAALIPVKYLINGSTILQVPVDRVTYHHIELAEHDVVLAEGLPAESFLDMRDRSNYANRPGPVGLYPDFTARMWEAFGCAPLIVTGPELTAARVLVAGFATEQEAA